MRIFCATQLDLHVASDAILIGIDVSRNFNTAPFPFCEEEKRAAKKKFVNFHMKFFTYINRLVEIFLFSRFFDSLNLHSTPSTRRPTSPLTSHTQLTEAIV